MVTRLKNMKSIAIIPVMLLLFSCTENTPPENGTAKNNETFSTEGKRVIVYTTADSSNYRISATDTVGFKEMKPPLETQICVFVEPIKKFQTYLGIGAALTDASAETFYKLPKEKQQEVLQAYFDKQKGIGYTVARTNINSCDFSSDMYTYVTDGDKDLKSFNIDHDKKYKIPFIKEAMTAAGGKLNLFYSP